MTAAHVSMVIPTYNERDNIELLVKQLHAILEQNGHPFEIIVVDDDSPDRTWELVENLARECPGVRLIRRRDGRGLARAVVRGWREARGDILAVMDGDLQHPPETLARLVAAIDDGGADIAVASRNVSGGGVSRWSAPRRAVSWSATLAAAWILPGTLRTVRDPMSGYFALRRSVIDGLNLEPEGYKILLEVLVRGRYGRVTEVPYYFVERSRGGSKLGIRQYWEFITHLGRLAWRSGELERFLRFCVVGLSGVFVNMIVLVAVAESGLGYLPAGVAAIETALISNFLLNEFWSFADLSRRRPELSARVGRFLKFNLFCAGGAVINLVILWAATEWLGLHFVVSNLIGIAAATVWNYGSNANVTWNSTRAGAGGFGPTI